MDATLGLLTGIITAGHGGGAGVQSGGSILTISKDEENNRNMSVDDDLELGLGLSIGGGLKTNEEASRILKTRESSSPISSCSSSSSVNIPNSSIDGTKRTGTYSVSPTSTSVVGWPPIRRGHRLPNLNNRIKSEHEDFRKNITNGHHHLCVKVNMDGTLIGRKVDLFAHTSYQMLAQTLEDMFYESRSNTVGSSRLLDETSEFVLTYEDKDGDCMLVGDVPWMMFLQSVKRLRILRNPKMQH